MIKSFICMAAIILACLLPISCGYNSRQSAGDESAGLEETDVAESDSKGRLMPVPVYSGTTVHFALMNPRTGELVQFDNDEDYSGYCTFFCFVKKCDVAYHEYKELFGINWDAYRDDFLKNNRVVVSDTVYNFHLSLINAVMDYLNGNKDKIKDRKLFKRIDKAFYDIHPDQGYYSLEHSEYGLKRYSSTNNHMLTELAITSDYYSYSNYLFHDGTALPEGTLVFTQL